MFETYKPSGGIGIMLFPALLLGIAIAIGLSYVYQLLLDWIPFIYVSFLLTIGAGVVLSVVGAVACSFGHCRNRGVGLIVGMLLTVAFIGGKFWFQFQASVPPNARAIVMELLEDEKFDVKPEERKQLVEDMVANQFTILNHLQARVDQGWQIGRRGQGIPVSGVFVYLVWLVELLIVLFTATSGTRAQAAAPYSEKLSTWASEEEHVMTLPVTDDEMISQIRSAASVEQLLEIPIPKTDQSNVFAIYKTNSIPGQELEDAYLSVQLLELSVNNKGEEERKETPLVTHAILSSEKRKELVENASLLEEAIADYRNAVNEEAMQAEGANESDDPNAPDTSA